MSTHQKREIRAGNATNGISFEEPLIFERSRSGRIGYSLPECDVPAIDAKQVLSPTLIRDDLPNFPEVSEADVVRHFTRLSTWNAAVDQGIYPLGSCTMKYNPRVNEAAAALPGFAQMHPMQPPELSQGILQLLWELERDLAEISGLDCVSLQPAAGAQGELVGMMMIRAYHESRGDQRKRVIIPDTAHGTNPASAALNGYEVIPVASGSDGVLHPEAVRAVMGPDVAAIMITNPNTLGLFETHIAEIAEIVHQGGGLVYGDGANLNAILGVARPGDLGIDVMHFNLHKTFSTPHGGGGPGAGPVGAKAFLAPFLPSPVIVRSKTAQNASFTLDKNRPQSIGRVHAHFGNVAMAVRAYTYIRSLGPDAIKQIAEMAVLNANYALARLRTKYAVPIDQPVMHECVLSDQNLKPTGVTTLDIAKRLIDYGYHPPTTYFPLVVAGALMIEPTESESLEGLDRFIDALLEIEREARETPDLLHGAPHHTRLGRLNETQAARKPILRWQPASCTDGN